MFPGLATPLLTPPPPLNPVAQDEAFLERLGAALRGAGMEPNEHVDAFEVPMAWV